MATVDCINVQKDGCGAPALVSHGRYSFKFNTRGDIEVRHHGPGGPRLEYEAAMEMCRKAYIRERAKLVDAAWLARNAARYRVTTI